jgi:TRAP-type uncharacterized transport system substrate-binding protein
MRVLESTLTAVALAMAVALAASPASAKSVRLVSGEAGGTYHEVFAKNVSDVLDGKVKVRTTTGSAENLDLLTDGKADFGFAQADVFALRMEEEPDVFGELSLVGHLKPECVFLAHRKSGPLEKWSQLSERVGDRRPIVALGPYGSGMADSWNYLLTLVPGISRAVTRYEGGARALDQLVSGEIDAVGWMTDPENANHVMIRGTRERKELALLTLDDPALAGDLPDGKRVYVARTLTFGDAGDELSVETVCTDALLFAAPGADEGVASKLAKALERIAAER